MASCPRWLNKSLFGPLLSLFLVTSCDDGAGGLVELEYSEESVTFDNVNPSEGEVQRELTITNVGTGTVRAYDVGLEGVSGDCGSLSIDAFPPYPSLRAGDQWTVTVTFTPAENATSGCGCLVTGRLAFEYDVGSLGLRIPVTVRGACDSVLGCTQSAIEFSEAVTEATYREEIRCVNLTDADVDINAVELSGGASSYFSAETPRETPPLTLAPAAEIEIAVEYMPLEEGDHEDEVVVLGAEGSLAEIALFGSATRERPRCSAEAPVDPEPELRGPDYEILLESNTPSDYIGTLRSFWYYEDQPPLIADYLVTSGSYADPECEVGQRGHMAYWEGEACVADGGGGVFANVHALPHSALVEEWLQSLEEWDVVTIRGYEVDRINYDDGSWWTDSGCHTLVITWVCDVD